MAQRTLPAQPCPLLRGAVTLTEPRRVMPSRSSLAADAQSRPLEPVGDRWLLTPGARIACTATNESDARLFLTALLLESDSSVRRIAPVDGRQATVQPGGSLRIEWKVPPLPAGAAEGTAVLKLFSTSVPVSFDALLLPSLQGGDLYPTEQVRDGGPLSALLDSVRRTGTRPVRFAAATDPNDQWDVLNLEFVVRPAG